MLLEIGLLFGEIEALLQVPHLFIVDFRINETLQTGAVGNRTYRVGANAVRSETAPTGGESVYLFLEFTIVFSIHFPLHIIRLES